MSRNTDWLDVPILPTRARAVATFPIGPALALSGSPSSRARSRDRLLAIASSLAKSTIEAIMNKHKRNTTSHTDSHRNKSLALQRETVRLLTQDDLALAIGGSTTILTEKPTTGQNAIC